MKPHYNDKGEICNCGFGQYNEPVEESIVKEAGAKLDWIRDREDKFFKTEEGQRTFRVLENLVERNEKIDPLVPWLWREAKKKRLRPQDVDPARINHIADWYASNSPTRRGVDIMQLDVDQLAAKIDEWDEELRANMGQEEMPQGIVVEELSDGWTIQQIVNKEQAKAEGDAMGHCVGGYGSSIEGGSTLIYSLRDPKGLPHATVEITPEEYNPEFQTDLDSLKKALKFVNDFIPKDSNFVELIETNRRYRQDILETMSQQFSGGVNVSADNIDPNSRIGKIFEHVKKLAKMKAEGKDIDAIVKQYCEKQLTKIDPSGGQIVQIQGKENKKPIPKYQEMIAPWLLDMDSPPRYQNNRQYVYAPAPSNLSELIYWLDPFNYSDAAWESVQYNYELVEPRRAEDYFPEGQEHGYLGGGEEDEPDIQREPISERSLRAVADSIVGLSENPNDLPLIYDTEDESMRNQVPIDVQTVNYIVNQLDRVHGILDDFRSVLEAETQKYALPEFEKHYFDEGDHRSMGDQWHSFDLFRLIDSFLGYNFVSQESVSIGGQTEQIPGQAQMFIPIDQKQLDRWDAQELAYRVNDLPLWRQRIQEQEGLGKSDAEIMDYLKTIYGEQDDSESYYRALLERARGGDLEAPYTIPKFTKRSWFKKLFNRKSNILDPISDKLDGDIWALPNNPRPVLKEEVRNWITHVITRSLIRNGYTHMEDWMSLVLTGSLTTYQYSPSSDCDISVFVDAEMFPEWSRAEMIAILMDECDGRLVPGTGHPLQCYVVAGEFTKEDLYQPGMRSAYDITASEWIVAPERDRVHDVKSEMNEAYTIALENADKMEKLIRYEPMKALQFYNQIHRRRRRDMQLGKGDFTPSNISYKMMDNRGLFDQIKNITKEYRIKQLINDERLHQTNFKLR